MLTAAAAAAYQPSVMANSDIPAATPIPTATHSHTDTHSLRRCNNAKSKLSRCPRRSWRRVAAAAA